MLTNSQIKYINSLQAKKYRQKYKQFIAEGEKIINELLNSDLKMDTIYAVKGWQPDVQSLKNELNIIEVSELELEKISSLTTPNKVLAIVEVPQAADKNYTHHEDWMLALDNIQDPGNMGTIIRIADWFGIEYIFCSPDCVDVYNPKVVQGSMGSIARVKVIEVELKEFFGQQKNIKIYGATLEGENIFHLKNSGKGFLLIGNESRGIRHELLPFIHRKITIPSNGKAESLNAAVATGIMCAWLRNNNG